MDIYIYNVFVFVYCHSNKSYKYILNPLEVHGSNFITDKKDTLMHGYGIDIIRNIVNKYNGTMDIEYSSNKFLIVIIIKIST